MIRFGQDHTRARTASYTGRGSAGCGNIRFEWTQIEIWAASVLSDSKDSCRMAREMPARAMRLRPCLRAVRHPVRCALDVYVRYGLWLCVRGDAPRQIASDDSVCSLQRQGRRAAPAVTTSCLASLDYEYVRRFLRHWLPMRASKHYNNRHHPRQSFILCVAPPIAHL